MPKLIPIALGLVVAVTLTACSDDQNGDTLQVEQYPPQAPGQERESSEQLDDAVHSAMDNLREAADRAANVVEDVNHTLSKQASESVDAVKRYLADHDLDSAQKILNKLKAVAIGLPANLQEQIHLLDLRVQSKIEAARREREAAE